MFPNIHDKASPQGGLSLNRDGSQISAVKEVCKTIFFKAKQGKITNIINISKPAHISSQQTSNEIHAYNFFDTKYLDEANNTSDPLERIKLVTSFFINNLYISLEVSKIEAPLNPLLGETNCLISFDDNVRQQCEQTSHHPPISHYFIESKKGWKIHGWHELICQISGLQTIDGVLKGPNAIKFKDGSYIVYTNPWIQICNLFKTTSYAQYTENINVQDRNNHIGADIIFNDADGYIQGAVNSVKEGVISGTKAFTDQGKKLIGKKSQITHKKLDRNKLPDQMNIEIYENVNEVKKIIEHGEGSWLEGIRFKDKIYWMQEKIDDLTKQWYKNNEEILDSDAYQRQDKHQIENNDFINAQKFKTKQEDQQRQDAQLRNVNN